MYRFHVDSIVAQHVADSGLKLSIKSQNYQWLPFTYLSADKQIDIFSDEKHRTTWTAQSARTLGTWPLGLHMQVKAGAPKPPTPICESDHPGSSGANLPGPVGAAMHQAGIRVRSPDAQMGLSGGQAWLTTMALGVGVSMLRKRPVQWGLMAAVSAHPAMWIAAYQYDAARIAHKELQHVAALVAWDERHGQGQPDASAVQELKALRSTVALCGKDAALKTYAHVAAGLGQAACSNPEIARLAKPMYALPEDQKFLPNQTPMPMRSMLTPPTPGV